MTDLQPDEKLCPYCAEVIKAAAVKCRWCQSDLSVPAPVPAVTPAPVPATTPATTPAVGATSVDEIAPRDETAPVAEPGDGPVPAPPTALPGTPWARSAGTRSTAVEDDAAEEDAATPWWAGARLMGALIGALVGLLVVAVVLVATKGRAPAIETSGPEAVSVRLQEASARDAALMAATNLTEAALSYKWNTLDADMKKAQQGMTADFRKQYLDAMKSVTGQTRKNQIVLTAKVVAAGLVAATDSRADVLVFTNQSTTTKSSDAPRIDQNRVLVTLARSGGDWRLSAMKAF